MELGSGWERGEDGGEDGRGGARLKMGIWRGLGERATGEWGSGGRRGMRSHGER